MMERNLWSPMFARKQLFAPKGLTKVYQNADDLGKSGPTLEGCFRLLKAVSLSWCKSAQRDETELSDLAEWLAVDRETLRAALADRRFHQSVAG